MIINILTINIVVISDIPIEIVSLPVHYSVIIIYVPPGIFIIQWCIDTAVTIIETRITNIIIIFSVIITIIVIINIIVIIIIDFALL